MKIKIFFLTLSFFVLSGCSTFSYYNVPLKKDSISYPNIPTFAFPKNKRNDRTLVILALSGGGSRAAYLSTSIMLKLESIGLLDKVDIISSISGGSIAGAYYCVTGKKDQNFSSGRYWEAETARKEMKKDFILRFAGNSFWPDNIILYWIAGLTRTGIMSQTLADNLYDTNYFGFDLKLRELNPERPMLLINATISTFPLFGNPFVFTLENFKKINSDLGEFPISHAVMASAGFPGVFQYSVLKNHKSSNEFVHLYDGGVYDNLGLRTTKKIIEGNKNSYDNFVVISSDAFNDSFEGISSKTKNTKGYIVDSTLKDSYDAILKNVRTNTLNQMLRYEKNFTKEKQNIKKNFIFLHFSFENLLPIGRKQKNGDTIYQLLKKTNEIPTSLSITDEDAGLIDQSVDILFSNIEGNEEITAKLKKVQELFPKK